MNIRIRITIAFCMLVAALFAVGSSSAQIQSPASPQAIQAYMGTAFNYTGFLTQGGSSFTGTLNLRFNLFDSATGGIQLATFNASSVSINQGRFTVVIDFGQDVFNGEQRWLETQFYFCLWTCGWFTFTPRVELRPTPYALALPGLWTQQNPTSANLIGGYWGNTMGTGVVGGVVGGGGNSSNINRVYDSYGTIGGGRGNLIGTNNGNSTDAHLATIGGGLTNEATNVAATVAGGWSNIASGAYAAVAGGEGNIASGSHASVPGGFQNTASGVKSFAAGNEAKATHQGAFVWADSQSGSFSSTTNNQFSVRACGGARFVTCGQGLTVDGNPVQIRVSGVCSPGFAVRQVNADGSVVCEATGGGGSFWSLTGNIGTNPATNFLGTTDNVVLEVRVNNARAFRFEPTSGAPNLIGGSSTNTVTTGVVGATIDGGGINNRVTDDRGSIGGGTNNQAGDNAGTTSDKPNSTVGGGADNTASGGNATVAGGQGNVASGNQAFAGGGNGNNASGGNSVVVGGGGNSATGGYATVGGGFLNTATGWNATVPGGEQNSAVGYSFAAGYRGKANHTGVFLYSDASSFDFVSNTANEFAVRSTGGARFVLAVDGSGNPTWTCSVSNGGSWACSSDRNLKENLVEVSGKQVLQALENLPLYTWSAKGADPSVLHMGPTAQDFKAAFGLGDSDIAISTIDLDGVALAAIQGLKAENDELSASNASLQNRVDKLEQRLMTIEARQGVGLAAFLLYTLLIASALLIGLAAALLFKRRGGAS